VTAKQEKKNAFVQADLIYLTPFIAFRHLFRNTAYRLAVVYETIAVAGGATIPTREYD